MAQQNVLRLLEILEALRDETVKRLDEIEEKVRGRSEKKDLAKLMELVYHLTTAVSLGHYLQILAREGSIALHEFEDNMTKLLRLWKKVIEGNRELFGVVDWSIVQDGSKIILKASRKIGLPFGTVASRIIEVMGADSEKAISEASIAEIYGTINLSQWRRLVAR